MFTKEVSIIPSEAPNPKIGADTAMKVKSRPSCTGLGKLFGGGKKSKPGQVQVELAEVREGDHRVDPKTGQPLSSMPESARL